MGRVALEALARRTWLFPRHIALRYQRRILAVAAEYAHGTLVDVGCGTRPYEDLFVGHVRRYIGIDWPAPHAAANPHVVGDATQLPLRDGSANSVLATEVMEHVAEPALLLAEIARVLAPGGVLILSVPFLEPIHEEPRDFFRFTPFGLHHLLGRSGFAVEALWHRGGWWSVMLGSFVSRAIYDAFNPVEGRSTGRRSTWRTLLPLPICAAAQIVGYGMDRVVPGGDRYSLGFTLVARLPGRTAPAALGPRDGSA